MRKIPFNRYTVAFLTLLQFLSFSYAMASNWDIEYWQYFNWTNFKHQNFQLYTTAELRANKDISTFYYVNACENFAYQACLWLDLEAHYCFVYSKNRGSSIFTTTQRAEVEINPHFTLQSGINIKWRNRLTFNKKQRTQLVYLLRDRLRIEVPIDNCGNLISYSCSNEVYYDFNISKLTQNRLIPLSLTFQLSRNTTLEAFLMIRNFYSPTSEQWYRSIVLGSEFGF